MTETRKTELDLMDRDMLCCELVIVDERMQKSPRCPRPDEQFPKLTEQYQKLMEDKDYIEDRIEILESLSRKVN